MVSTDDIRPARGSDTRRAILEAAMALYARRGVKGTGLAAIGEAAGVTHAGVLHHFGSSRKLLLAVIDERDRRFWRDTAEHWEGKSGLEALRRLPRLAEWNAAIVLAALASACSDGGSDACAGKTGAAGSREITINSGGLERSFLLDVPESALGGEPVPLLLVFHGVLSNGAEIEAVTGFPAKAAQDGFITAAGNGVGQSWNAGVCCQPAQGENVDDVGFARDMVAAIESEYCIDTARVYATGFSNGSAMVFRLACEAADLFAAFAPVGGSLALFPCEPSVPRPTQIINNIPDPVVPFALGEFSFGELLRLNACSAERTREQLAPTASCEIAPECADGATTELCAVENVGHRWPGGATDPNGHRRGVELPLGLRDLFLDFISPLRVQEVA
jgi:polyhydroxybutyrate depolymerase